MNRRDIFKMFAAGALVSPLIDGLPSAEVARIVLPPKVEPVRFAPCSGWPEPGNSKFNCVLYMRETEGKRSTFSFDAYLLEINHQVEVIDVTSCESNVRRTIAGMRRKMLIEITAGVRMES